MIAKVKVAYKWSKVEHNGVIVLHRVWFLLYNVINYAIIEIDNSNNLLLSIEIRVFNRKCSYGLT